ncbi:FAD-linked sulfhydryl oxidase ERV1 [Tetrabaena socialis]|uniref:Sulfhydryl oxidase n=1 Tax=Tetrabaena socialis TaxID=47790 RepID=A0A2J7ZX47_9CHLO|nr:FAD-linked sulfhydryl oxidase ERV1 [Tetrabaena socialis]|eukprot:PNH04851.1 FAD-linked sulfhydryl oxidase ERV1 [Tetrabaena socialis]
MPQRPSRQQQRDAAALVDCLTRIYPCGECAAHFGELVRRDPPAVRSGPEFRRWLCRVHNRVNARIGKPPFNCDLVDSRWAPLGCGAAEEGQEGGGGDGPVGAGCELLGVGAAGPRQRK